MHTFFWYCFLQGEGEVLESKGKLSNHESSKSGTEGSNSVGHSELTSISSKITGLHFPPLLWHIPCNHILQCTNEKSFNFSISSLLRFLLWMLSKVVQFHRHQCELQGWFNILIAALWRVGISYPYPAHQSPENGWRKWDKSRFICCILYRKTRKIKMYSCLVLGTKPTSKTAKYRSTWI